MNQVVLLLLSFCAACCVGKRHLVFIAGPHQSEANSLLKFFYDHAKGKDSEKTSNGLDGWVWPQVEYDLPGKKHKYFENFFSLNQNETVRSLLLESIKESWTSSKHGVIVGAEGFDNTRGDQNSLGLKIMQEIVTAIGIKPDQVHVVTAYRSPRIDQWMGFYENSDTTYENFACNHSYTEHIVNIPMNPLMLANIYLGEGYNVSTVDLGGVRSLNLDPAHAVACKILPHTKCQDGWLEELKGKTSGHHQVRNEKVYEDIPADKQKALENLFRDRDCSYRHLLEDEDRFRLIHQDSIWANCGWTMSSAFSYSSLSDPLVFYDMVKDLSGCGNLPSDKLIVYNEDDTTFRMNLFFLTFIGLSGVIFAYQVMGKHMRRKTNYDRSPKSGMGEDIWIDFENGTETPNLRSSSSESDGTFTDVNLISPRLASPSFMLAGKMWGERNPHVTAAVREGRSVRHAYRVGLYQDACNAKSGPSQEDSHFESNIKSLEKEFS